MKKILSTLTQMCREHFWALSTILLTTLCLIGPLLFSRGFVLTLDMVFAPNHYIQWESLSSGYRLWNDIPLELLRTFASSLLGGEFVQKLTLFVLFMIMGISMYTLVPSKNKWVKILASVFFMVNPFVHTRLLAGHWQFLVGYAGMPFFLQLVMFLFEKPKREFKRVIHVSLMWIFLTMISVHHVILCGVVFMVFAIGEILQSLFLKNKKVFRILQKVVYVLVSVFLGVLYWVIPYITSGFHELDSFTLNHLYVFATLPDIHWGMLPNVFGLYGFWQEDMMFELSKYSIGNIWFFIYLLIFLFCILGSLYLARTKKKLVYILWGIGGVSIIFSLGIFGNFYTSTQWLYEFLPGFRGMRELQKFLSLLPLVYSVFFALGIESFIEKSKIKNNWKKGSIIFFATLTLCIYSHAQFAGVGLKTTRYPESWYELKNIRGENTENKILSLPWHQYSYLNFIGRNTLDPTPIFFGANVISRKNMNVIGVDSEKYQGVDADIKKLIQEKNEEDWKQYFMKKNITYIVLHRNFETSQYAFLQNFSFLQPLSQDSYTTILQVQ